MTGKVIVVVVVIVMMVVLVLWGECECAGDGDLEGNPSLFYTHRKEAYTPHFGCLNRRLEETKSEAGKKTSRCGRANNALRRWLLAVDLSGTASQTKQE